MAELRARLKPLFRRSSTATTTSTGSNASSTTLALDQRRANSKSSLLLPRSRRRSVPESVREEEIPLPLPLRPSSILDSALQSREDDRPDTPSTSLDTPRITPLEKANPTLTVEEPTPDLTPAVPQQHPISELDGASVPDPTPPTIKTPRPSVLPRRQSLANNSQGRFLSTLLEAEKPAEEAGASDYFGAGPLTVSANMLHRKIWVKRLGQSATMVTISEEDLVDDARDMILKKYANSLGRQFDSPDITLRIVPRTSGHRQTKGERTLGPDEQLSRTLDAYFPGGQTVDEALLIDVPQRRTPRHSPRVPLQYYAHDDLRPSENGGDYFPTIPIQGQPSPRLAMNAAASASHATYASFSRHLERKALFFQRIPYEQAASPSPNDGVTHRLWNDEECQPRYADIHKAHPANVPAPPPLPSPQIPADGQPLVDHAANPERVASPRPNKAFKRTRKTANTVPKLPAGLLDGAVPPINVLIVEDNIINLKLLEAFMKRLKVRFVSAMNGREAVNKWRQGGFHLVLMDIQLPVMNGLDATKEIRRLERLNKIGVFSNSAASTPTAFAHAIDAALSAEKGEEGDAVAPAEEDNLISTHLFKSPVIIVALTASSLQSDRHEALAAGCNDFLTKPVNFVWLERKVMEWGCMQALIDFDGWRKWKDFSSAQTSAQAPPSSSSTANNNNKTTPSSSLLSAAKKEKESEGVNGVSKGKKSLALLKTGSSAGRGVGGKRASVGGSEGLETAVAGGGG
ncbi:MAG: hypothetical protein LQ350_005822 [Teloschistes chrysophthalmus]|nr:MAG: hypothetical protein LQ350_005822 [Niorma chrysophthalma]